MSISRGRTLIAVVALLAAVAGIEGTRSDGEDQYVALSEEAGTDVSVRQLMIRGERDQVRSAVREYEGSILTSYGDQHKVLFPVKRLADLRRLEDALEAQGFDADYVPVARLFSGLDTDPP